MYILPLLHWSLALRCHFSLSQERFLRIKNVSRAFLNNLKRICWVCKKTCWKQFSFWININRLTKREKLLFLFKVLGDVVTDWNRSYTLGVQRSDKKLYDKRLTCREKNPTCRSKHDLKVNWMQKLLLFVWYKKTNNTQLFKNR